jgi:hypothetical protein
MIIVDPQLLLAAAAVIGNLSSLVWAIRRPADRRLDEPEQPSDRCGSRSGGEPRLSLHDVRKHSMPNSNPARRSTVLP